MNHLNHLKLCSEITCNYIYAPDNREHPELRVAQLGESAGAIGAALLSAL